MAWDAWEHEIADYLTAHPKVVLAFLFGSFSKGKSKAGSDVDVAVYLAPPYSADDVSDVWSHLEDLTHRDVDLLVLNTAPPIISWTAMKGKVLVNKDRKLHLELMLERSREAEDFRGFLMDFWRERRRRWGDEGAQSLG
ncbi:MAG: nucleotidyltransferase domain-containing protein [Bacillota bacterium]|nr:nucleotidyltransferase domain-containing protein [Bacillota bacterium]